MATAETPNPKSKPAADTAASAPAKTPLDLANEEAAKIKLVGGHPVDEYHGLAGSYTRDPVTGKREPADDTARKAVAEMRALAAASAKHEADAKAASEAAARAAAQTPADGQ